MDKSKTDCSQLVDAAFKAWCAAAEFRKNRKRNKNFTYGKQWLDVTVDEEGNKMSERDAILKSGREPLSNNMIRQLVKSVVGRYRNIAKDRKIGDRWLDAVLRSNDAAELDSRMLEEFLISGCCVQKTGVARRLNKMMVNVENVNPNRFFVNSTIDPRGSDITLIGELHDKTIAEIILMLAPNNRAKAAMIRNLYNCDADRRMRTKTFSMGESSVDALDFFVACNGKCRLIEVWTLETAEYLTVHNRTDATVEEMSVEQFEAIKPELRKNIMPSDVKWAIREVWRCRWLTPAGDLIAEYDSPFAHDSHPYVVKFYPLTDGEVHSFVEDVIDQQKYINRLIVMADHIMSASAKGVLLYPNDAVPSGFSWNDIRRMWRSPNGIIPYDSSAKTPVQVNSPGTNQGAFDLLNLEMRLFDAVSGVSGAMQGREVSASTGANLYQKQTENATIALSDIFDTFISFTDARNRKLVGM